MSSDELIKIGSDGRQVMNKDTGLLRHLHPLKVQIAVGFFPSLFSVGYN